MQKRHFLTFLSFVALLILFALAQTPQASAQTPVLPPQSTIPNGSEPEILEFLGRLGGEVTAVDVQGDYAYIALGLRLLILDISDPTQPRMVGTEAPSVAEAKSINATTGNRPEVPSLIVEGDFVYMNEVGWRGLRILDVSEPSHPTEVFQSAEIGTPLAVKDSYAYISGAEGLQIFDMSDPSAPVQVGLYPQRVGVMRIVGDFAYTSTSSTGISILDLSDPTTPTEVGSHPTNFYVRDLAVVDDLLYFVETGRHEGDTIQGGDLHILDISDRTAPVELGVANAPGFPEAVAVIGQHVYVSEWSDTRIFDASDPGNIEQVGTYDPELATNGLVATESALYLITSNALEILDVSAPATPQVEGRYVTLLSGSDVLVSHPLVYVTSEVAPAGIHILDVTNPQQPIQTAFYETNIAPAAAVGSYLYLRNGDILDVSDPFHPTEAAQYGPLLRGPSVVKGNYLFGPTADGMAAFDVSNPTEPTQVGFYRMDGAVLDMVVAEGYAYLLTASTFHIVDVSDPSAPTRTYFDREEADFIGSEITLLDDYAYLLRSDRIHIVDIQDRSEPKSGGFIYGPWQKHDLTGLGNYLFYLYGREIWSSGLRILDASDPANPREVSAGALAITAKMVADERYLYWVGENGFYMARLAPTAPSALALSHLEARPGTTLFPLGALSVSLLTLAALHHHRRRQAA